MAKLAIYVNEAGESVLHRGGFSWLAAIVPPIWALQHRLYKTFIATFVVGTLVNPTIALVLNGSPRITVQLGWVLLQLVSVRFGATILYNTVLTSATTTHQVARQSYMRPRDS